MEVLAGLDAVSRIKSSYDSGIKKMTRPFESKIKFEQKWIFLDLGTFLIGLRWKSVAREIYYSMEIKDGC